VASFGRGAYVLDDYTALRDLTSEVLNQEAALFQLRDAYLFNELGQVRAAWGDPVTPNPPFGALFTYNVGRAPEGEAKLVLIVSDDAGKPVRRLDLSKDPGVHRVSWNLRGEAPPSPAGQGRGAGGGGGRGGQQVPLVAAGRYRAQLAKVSGDATTPVGEMRLFNVVALQR
jgi:hypothetical protein